MRPSCRACVPDRERRVPRLRNRDCGRSRQRERARHVLRTDLTDRQRATLEAAYRSGLFKWPRRTIGEDVAQSLEIAPPTFH
ncbi:helix-turn-helix domain-containing protein [Natronoglomus mannanivorans]|uniref:helix-turn-helix domain-containing protein n=1 Tax=Natronoglomus mannanivorans TaxID=2979990 RepID=UPI003CCD5CBF